MSVLPKESVKILAETVGIANLNDEVSAALAADVEYRLREIAQVTMSHSLFSFEEVFVLLLVLNVHLYL